MRIALPACLFVLVLGSIPAAEPPAPVLAPAARALPAAPSAWAVDYARWSDGHAYTGTEAKADWPTLVWFEEPGDAFIREFPAGSGRKWLEPRFKAGTHTKGAHGCKFAAALAPSNTYTVEYAVHFPKDWEFSQKNTHPYGGGKLPGLSGGSHPSGGLGKPDGMSARPMWRRDNRFTPAISNYLELYLYWRNQSEKYGDRFFVQGVEAGHTYQIKLQVDLGTPDRDGTVRMWIDGALRLEKPFRFLSPGQDWKLTQYMHNVFYGGNDPTWAPAHDQHLLLGPVKVSAVSF
jgi:hypothetical protein